MKHVLNEEHIGLNSSFLIEWWILELNGLAFYSEGAVTLWLVRQWARALRFYPQHKTL